MSPILQSGCTLGGLQHSRWCPWLWWLSPCRSLSCMVTALSPSLSNQMPFVFHPHNLSSFTRDRSICLSLSCSLALSLSLAHIQARTHSKKNTRTHSPTHSQAPTHAHIYTTHTPHTLSLTCAHVLFYRVCVCVREREREKERERGRETESERVCDMCMPVCVYACV